MNQDKIWRYFQEQSVESFSGSIPRLKYLFYKAKKFFINAKPTVLNIGVGNGWLEQRCILEGWDTYSLDPSEEAIKKLEKSGIKGKVGYIENIPYGDNLFDAVFCSEVIEHLSNEQIIQGLYEIERVLKKSGILIGTVPFKEDLLENKVVCPDCGHIFHRWGHQQSFEIKSLAAIFPKTMKIEQVKVISFVSWSSLNWKGVLLSIIKQVLSVLGIHGSNYNLFFCVRK